MKLAFIFAVIMAALCATLTFAQTETPFGFFFMIESKEEVDGKRILDALEPTVVACSYGGGAKVDHTKDFKKHWYAMITTPLQMLKNECSEDYIKLAVGENNFLKKYVLDKTWPVSTCTKASDNGPVINCETKNGKCDGSIMCSSSIMSSTMLAFVLIAGVIGLFA